MAADRITLEDGLRAFLDLAFEAPKRPFDTQREMREEAARQLGYAQAQEQLRDILAQVSGRGRAVAHELAEVRNDRQLKPMAGPGDVKLWMLPEFEVRR